MDYYFTEARILDDLDLIGIGTDHSQSQKRPRETFSEADQEKEDKMGNDSAVTNWLASYTQPGFMAPTYGNRTNQAPPSTPNAAYLKRSNSTKIPDPERAERKKIIDQKYRQRCKKVKEEMQVNLETLTGENESLKKENESLKKDNADMNQTLKDQAKEIERLRNDLSQLKREWEKQNVLVQTLSGLIADPVRLENEKLKEENASLRKNVRLNEHVLLEENTKLKLENKVLKVQNDALCGKIISDERKHEEQEAKISTLAVL